MMRRNQMQGQVSIFFRKCANGSVAGSVRDGPEFMAIAGKRLRSRSASGLCKGPPGSCRIHRVLPEIAILASVVKGSSLRKYE